VATTLWLQHPNNNFLQSLCFNSGTTRVNTSGALGSYVGTLSIDIQNGSFEIRADAPALPKGRAVAFIQWLKRGA
jgi:hypothetical protein